MIQNLVGQLHRCATVNRNTRPIIMAFETAVIIPEAPDHGNLHCFSSFQALPLFRERKTRFVAYSSIYRSICVCTLKKWYLRPAITPHQLSLLRKISKSRQSFPLKECSTCFLADRECHQQEQLGQSHGLPRWWNAHSLNQLRRIREFRADPISNLGTIDYASGISILSVLLRTCFAANKG